MTDKKRFLAVLLVIIMIMGGCGKNEDRTLSNDQTDSTQTDQIISDNNTSDNTNGYDSTYFSNRDFDISYDVGKSAVITLKGNTAECHSDAVKISGSTVTITDEGTYIISGDLDDGMIVVDSEKTDKTHIVLDGVNINCETSAAIYILQSDKVFITTAPGSTNTLSNGGNFEAIDENNIDSVIFSKEDLTINGSGLLVITSPASHGIVSKDSLTITGGSFDISCASHALSGKDDVCIADGEFILTSGKDGVHAENNDDETLGTVYIAGGNYKISSEGDGISASYTLDIDGGTFDITAGGGSKNAAEQSSDSWGNFMGGGRHHGGMQGGGFRPGQQGVSSTTTSDDSSSMKGIKATSVLTVNGGKFTVNSADDAFHSNGDMSINGGTFVISSGDDAFHADDELNINDGTINITESYEGLEGLHVIVSGGDIKLIADDDGINAAGGTDQSGTTGGRDGMFGDRMGGMSSNSNGSIVISGGKLDITAYGDGIDANGTLEITGGYTKVCGPTQGDTATLDYDKTATISDGTFIGTGSSMMAQSISSDIQGVIGVSVGNQSAGNKITIKDDSGNFVFEYAPALNYAVLIYSSPDIVKGETYSITVGNASGNITAN